MGAFFLKTLIIDLTVLYYNYFIKLVIRVCFIRSYNTIYTNEEDNILLI